jgi:hypothetical protein
MVEDTLACCATCEIAGRLVYDRCLPPEDAVILDIRKAEDPAQGPHPSKAFHAGTVVAALAVELLVFQARCVNGTQ